ncbi:MAG: hypothetical protein K9M75_00170 [Phycisphaerae bacterium]|nr:hypothetical protein [Phycisphaerae bacterium]
MKFLYVFIAFVFVSVSVRADDFKKTIEADWCRQEQVTRKLDCDSPEALNRAIDRGRLMIADMRRLGAEKAASKADRVISYAEAMQKEMAKHSGSYKDLYFKVRWAMRQLAFSNPAIDFDELLFVKRQWPWMNHQCGHRVGEAQIPGANLCVLKGLDGNCEVREILTGDYTEGGIGRPDLSYDAKRIVFPFAKKRVPATPYGSNRPGFRGGACYAYDIYEVGVDGSGLKRLTNGPETEDTEPIYLPNDRIAFTTSRDDRYVQCGDWALACGIYTMDTNGSDLQRVTEPKEGEFYPSMLEDGRIMYTRWDYVMKGYNVIQQLWAVNPDGRKAGLLYGDHYAFSVGPITFQEARQIPGTSKIICTGAAHHNTCAGPIMIVDTRLNRGGPESMVNVTPEIGYPEINSRVFNEVKAEHVSAHKGMNTVANGTGWYGSPYPLTESHYLASYSFEKNNAVRNGYGLYLMDIHGNKELIYRAKDSSCYSPIPVKPRPRPRVIPDRVKGVPKDTPASVVITDIYQGLDGIKRGEVKHLRILETFSKTMRTNPQRCDVGLSSGWDVRAVLGTVPVEDDGSVHFYLPPYKQIFFEALDKDYLEIRRMRNFMNVMPGESVSCTGCHEPYGFIPKNMSMPMAMKRQPSKIAAPPWGAGGFSFKKIVQPILDSDCVRCHDGTVGKDKSFDLRGKNMVTAPAVYDRDQGPQHAVSDSFLKLVEYVSYIRVGGYQGEKLPLPVNGTGSRVSKLMKILKKGHYGVELDSAKWRTFAAWIDTNAQYYGGWDEIVLLKSDPKKQTAKNIGVRLLRKAAEADIKRHRQRIRELSRQNDSVIKAYINCGIDKSSGQSNKETIIQRTGKGYSFCNPSTIKGVNCEDAEITFSENEIVFDIDKFQKDEKYKLGLKWWDYNNAGRKQSVWVSAIDGSKRKKLLSTTVLPAYKNKGQLPGEQFLDLPADLINKGGLRVCIQNEAGANAVLSEIWLETKARERKLTE